MQNNIEDPKKGKKLLVFLAEWADDAEQWDLKTALRSLRAMRDAYLESHAADDREQRNYVMLCFDKFERLLKRLKKQQPGVITSTLELAELVNLQTVK